MALAVVVVLCAVPALAVDGGGGGIEAQYGGGIVKPEDDLPREKGVDLLMERGAQQQLAEEERRRELASPGARAARERSETAHGGLSDGEAVALLGREFAPDMQGLTPDAGELARGRRLDGFLDDFTMRVVGRDGKPAIVQAPYPLRATEGGTKRPVDLDVEASGGGFAPKNGSTDVTLPGELSDGVRVGALRVVPAGDAEGSKHGTDEVVYPNAMRDSDVVLKPTATGAEAFAQLRSKDSPEQQRFRFVLPAGAQLRATGDGAAEVVEDGRRIAHVQPPSARDAQGQDVPVSYRIDGDQLVVEVAHRDRDLAYPILVDPVIEDWGSLTWKSGHNLWGLSHWKWSHSGNVGSNDYAPRTTCYTPVSCYSGAPSRSDGLHVYVRSQFFYPANSLGWWVYTPTGSTSYLTRFWYLHHYTMRGAHTYPYMFEGIWNDSAGNWSGLHVWPTDTYGNRWDAVAPTTGPASQARSARFGMGTNVAYYQPAWQNWRDAYLAGTIIEASDPENADITDTGVSGPSGWTSSGSWTIAPRARDVAPGAPDTQAGFGVRQISLSVPLEGGTTATHDRLRPCTTSKRSPCPATWTLGDDPYAPFTISADDGSPADGDQPLPEGITTLGIRAADALDKATTKNTTVKVDRSDPEVHLSGELVDAEDQVIHDPEYGLRVEASDGSTTSPAAERSGVRSVEIKVDGERKDYEEQSCPEGSCPLERDWLFESADYLPGPHTVTVITKDQLGHETIRSWSVTVDPTSVTCEGALNFQVYSLGVLWELLPLTDETRLCEPYDDIIGRNVSVSAIYGDCTPEPSEDPTEGGGCQVPIEVQSAPLCERHAALYNTGVEEPEPMPHENLVIRGVPAASFDDGTVLEVYTGTTTISVFGENAAQVRNAAEHVNLSTFYHGSDAPPPDTYPALPMPDQATLNSTQECTE